VSNPYCRYVLMEANSAVYCRIPRSRAGTCDLDRFDPYAKCKILYLHQQSARKRAAENCPHRTWYPIRGNHGRIESIDASGAFQRQARGEQKKKPHVARSPPKSLRSNGGIPEKQCTIESQTTLSDTSEKPPELWDTVLGLSLWCS
jgi:hypothetical protein